MKLMYIWIEKHNHLKELSIGVSSEFQCWFRKETEEDVLVISKGNKDLSSFFDFELEQKNTNIDFFGIVGENGIGKTTITDYINNDIFFSDCRGIYAFYDEKNREIIVKIYCTSGDKDIRIEKDQSICEKVTTETLTGGTMNLFTVMGIYRGYFSNALNYVGDYQKSRQKNDYTISSNILKSKYDIRTYYSNEFAKQINFIENKEKIEIGKRFSFSVPKKVSIAVPQWNKSDLSHNNSYLKGYDSAKRCNKEMCNDYEREDSMNRFAIIIILSIQKKILSLKDKRYDEMRRLTKEKLEEVCKSAEYKSHNRWLILLKDFFKKINKQEIEDPDIRTYLENCKNLFEKIEKLGIVKNESKLVDIDEVTGEQGIFALTRKISIGLETLCLQFDWALSSGERAILSLLANIKEFSDSIPEYAKKWDILMMIDELDLYLHPTLQQDIISILIEYINQFFENPSIQVIFTTHSPLVLSDMPREKLVFLRKNDEGKISVCDELEDNKTFGANITSLYYNSFGMHSGSMGTYASHVIRKIVKVLQDKENELSERIFGELSDIISCVGDAVIRKKLEEMLEKRRPQKSKLKQYYEKQVEYYTKRIKELENGND